MTSLLINSELHEAIAFHQAGQLDHAAQIYRNRIARGNDDGQGLHLLGVIALQKGRYAEAVDLIQRAIRYNARLAAFHCNIAEAYRCLGRLNEAAASCMDALRLQPIYPEAHNNLGLVKHAQGRFEDAIHHFGESLRLRPHTAIVCNNLANAYRSLGNLQEAEAWLRRALAIDPRSAEAHTNLGQLCLELYRRNEALVHCRKAVQLRPNLADAQNNLGNVLRELGQLEEAKASYAQALRLRPNLAMTCNNLGQAFQEEGQFDQAISWYGQALQIDPRMARVHTNLASIWAELEKWTDAVLGYETSLRHDPQYAEAHNGLGFAFHDQGRFDEAESSYREALRLNPRLVAAHINLGQLREELGDLEGARAALREALRHDPDNAAAYAQLATMLRGKLPDPDQEVIRDLLAEASMSAGKTAALHFGWAQVLDAKKEFSDAAAQLRKANAIMSADWRKRGKGYDPLEHTGFVDELIATFTPEFFARTRGFGHDSELPVFVVGLPRSSTTLTERILASHSQVHGAGELSFARSDFDSIPQVMSQVGPTRACLEVIERGHAQEIAQRHLQRLRELSTGAQRITDKMPDNYLYLGLLAMLFPRARFIHCRRDLRDVAVSCWMTNFRQIRWAFDPAHIASRFRDYCRLMDHWRRVLPVPFLEVDYEETVADLEGVAQRLVGWAGLEWEPGCLAFHETAGPVRTASVAQVRQPIYKQSVARWKNYEAELADLFDQLPIDPVPRLCQPCTPAPECRTVV